MIDPAQPDLNKTPETAEPDIYQVDPATGENRPLSSSSILDDAAEDQRRAEKAAGQ